MPPIVSIVGRSKSGKTTLIEKLVAELRLRGYHVATIKHTAQGIAFDEPGKDSWRHIAAGSEATVISSPDKLVLIKPLAEELNLDEAAYLLAEDYDIVLAEGFKQDRAPKIEVHRREAGVPLGEVKKLIAIASDEHLETGVRQFSLEDIAGIATFIEEGFIKPQRERTTLYVNQARIALSAFPRDVISRVLLGMVSSLKGVGKIKSLAVFLKREPDQF